MSDVLRPLDDAATAADVITSTQQWLERAVIGLNLCPFAKAVYVKRQIRYAVTAATTAKGLLAELRHEIEMLGKANPDEIDTTLLIHPQALTDFIDYHRFLKQADVAIRNLGQEGRLQIASFHPAYEFAGSAPDDIANFTNRSPYPMLHLLREVSIDRAVMAFPDAATIYERNIDTLRKLGHEGWRRLWTADQARDDGPASPAHPRVADGDGRAATDAADGRGRRSAKRGTAGCAKLRRRARLRRSLRS
jgi:hypothetical protein